MADEFTISCDLNCQKGSFKFNRSISNNPNFNGNCLFHEVVAVPISPTAKAALGVTIGGTGTPGIAFFTNLSDVFNIFIYANSDTSPFMKLEPGESFLIRAGTVTFSAQAILVSGATTDTTNNLEVAVFED